MQRSSILRTVFWSKYTAWMFCGGVLLVLFFVFVRSGFPQATPAASAPATVKPDVPKDPLGRTTPRGTVLGLLAAGRRGDNTTAAEYLNTRARGKNAEVLAHQLFIVLDRRLSTHMAQISDQPEGSMAGMPRLDQELVGTVSTANGNLEIVVERVQRGKTGLVWLFSSKTLDSIPDVYAEINVVSLHDVLPPFLVETRILGVPLFEWIAVFLGLPLVYLLLALLNRLLGQLAGLLRRRIRRTVSPDPIILPAPVRLFLVAVIIRWVLSKVSLPLPARQLWLGIATILVIAACLWLFLMLNSWGEAYTYRHLRSRNRTGTASILRLGRRVVEILSVFAAVLATLYYFGVSPTAALAGLGVGGIAVALAAQKTLENVVGGVSLILDQAVRTGDTLKVGEIVGTVEDVGLRSTRIRTSDRTLLIVPNGQIANMSLETLSLRDKYWFHPSLGLRYQTTSTQIRSIVDSTRMMLEEHPSIERGSVRVRFFRFGTFSLDVDISAYVYSSDWNRFMQIQEHLLFRISEIVEQAGTGLALPTQTTYVASDGGGTVLRDVLRHPHTATDAASAGGDINTNSELVNTRS